jgi:hypothetical protein
MTKAILILVPLLALGACAAPPAPSVPYYRIPPGRPEPPPTPQPPVLTEPPLTPIQPPPPLGEVIAPAAPGDYGRGAAVTAAPPPLAGPSPPSNPGPVTGYGTGGMEAMPGAPPNPPYTGPGLGPAH